MIIPFKPIILLFLLLSIIYMIIEKEREHVYRESEKVYILVIEYTFDYIRLLFSELSLYIKRIME